MNSYSVKFIEVKRKKAYHAVLNNAEVTLSLCVSEEFDFCVRQAQSVSWVARVGHALSGCATV